MTFTKSEPTRRAADWEAAGLDWLRVPGGAAVVRVLDRDERTLHLQPLAPVAPTPAAADDFGRRLATTHAAGASAFGVGPEGWQGEGLQGPVDELLPLPLAPFGRWGEMYATLRVEPLLERAGRRFAPDQRADFARLCDRLRGGDFDTGEQPARLHGDLWSGNLLWTPDGCVLIDPMAHAGHCESDLAALALFGCPHLPRILAAYDEASPLADGWRERVPLMHLHLVLLHVVLFGGGYAAQAASIARRYR
ncbi:MAG TPA: fructosamine kinase family protein [Propionibacteriaceae bacterium]|nr:fructosamine kinase family protein [Propionibacteriaceae bacterium]